MNNLTGQANWFKENKQDSKEDIKEVQIELPFLPIDTSKVEEFIKDLEIDYAIHSDKNLGDSILYFNMGLKALRNGRYNKM